MVIAGLCLLVNRGLRVPISRARSPTGLLLRGWSPVDRTALRADRILAVRHLWTAPL